MKYFKYLLSAALFVLFSSCSNTPGWNKLDQSIKIDFENGNLKRVITTADSLKKSGNYSEDLMLLTDSLADIAGRIYLDFSLSEDQVNEKIRNVTGAFTEEDKTDWERKGWLEFRIIDGEKKYFNRAASNLVLLREFYSEKEGELNLNEEDPELNFRLDNTKEIVEQSETGNQPVVPVKMHIIYTLSVEPDAVPDGEIIRCWLPFPRSGSDRQTDIKFSGASEKNSIISPDSAIHKTIYMEKTAKKGEKTEFHIEYNYTSRGQYFKSSGIIARPYDKESELYKKHTSQQPPQVVFTEQVKKLADSICGSETKPDQVVRKIYMWFKENIPWAGALEYSIMPDIPGYVMKNRRGDCGMQTFLFMSMLRYKGIPVRWQSGWMVPEIGRNLHDWGEVYYEGTGWVPADVSYGLQNSDNQDLKEFFLSGIDSYRLIVNNGFGGVLYPNKKYRRSEPYDFQRGEVEWSGGNLYFDKWDYRMQIEYTK